MTPRFDLISGLLIKILLRFALPMAVLVLQSTAALAVTVSLADPEQQLQFVGVLSPGQTNAEAVLIPLQHPVKVANRLIVVAKKKLTVEDFPAEHKARLNSLELLHEYQDRFIYIARVDTLLHALDLNELLLQHPSVFYSQPDLLPLRARSNDRRDIQNVLHFNAENFSVGEYLSLGSVWKKTKGRGIRVAVIDMGVSLYHPSLQKVKVHHHWDVDIDVVGATPEYHQTHGNKVVGVIWAQPQLVHDLADLTPGSAWGIAPEAELIALRLQRPWTSNLLKAFIRSEQQGADVINISWLIPWVAAPVRDYLRYLTTDANQKKGIVIVASASPVSEPNVGLAAMPELLVVTSTDHRDVLANCSWDKHVDIAAASYLLTVSQLPDRDYEMFAKTSSSAAVVSGWVALLRAARPDLTAAQLQSLLIETGIRPTQIMPGNQSFDYVVLDAQKSYDRLFKLKKSK